MLCIVALKNLLVVMMTRKKKTSKSLDISSNIASSEHDSGTNNDEIQETDAGKREFRMNLLSLWTKICRFDKEKIFVDPITEEIAPGYFLIVKQPMDLTTVKSKIDSDQYENDHDFQYDIQLMFTNAMQYNDLTTIYYKKAKKLLGQATIVFCGANSSQTDSQSQDSQINEGLSITSAAGPEKDIEESDEKFKKCVFEAYEIVVKWRKNVFELPTGSAGKAFIVHMKFLPLYLNARR